MVMIFPYDRWFGYFFSVLLLGWLWHSSRGRLGVAAAPGAAAAAESDDRHSILEALQVQLDDAIRTLLGDDERLVRWDVTDYTASMQTKLCPNILPMATNAILTHVHPETSSHLYELDITAQHQEIRILQAAMEVCILCITNHPMNRAVFAESQNLDHSYSIHDSVVTLLHVKEVAAKACHLIWIATYANAQNHAQFVRANVANALSTLILNAPHPFATEDDHNNSRINPSAVTIMWAAAALQNLAASYCDTPDDGCCYWEWQEERHYHDHADVAEEGSDNNNNNNHETVEHVLELTADSGTMIVDATDVRLSMSPSLLYRLLQWSCYGPVTGNMSTDNPFAGENARATILEHEQSTNIVSWAATGALSNLVIDPVVRQRILHEYGDATPCFCYLSRSRDWLESAKGQGILHLLRPDSEPCYFDWHGTESDDEESHTLCVDRIFTDIGDVTCAGYTDAEALTETDCATPDRSDPTVLASTACCQCGGGDHYVGPQSHRWNLHEAGHHDHVDRQETWEEDSASEWEESELDEENAYEEDFTEEL
jgi:hypothetical protein